MIGNGCASIRREKVTGSDQRHGVLRARRHDLQIVAAGQDAWLPGENHDGTVLLGAIQRSVERLEHGRRKGVDLAIAQRQRGNAVFELVGDQLTHDEIPCF